MQLCYVYTFIYYMYKNVNLLLLIYGELIVIAYAHIRVCFQSWYHALIVWVVILIFFILLI